MRVKGLILAALLTTTAIVAPSRADAGPVGAFLAGVWTGITTGVAAGVGIGGAFAAGMTAGAWVAGSLGGFLGQIVLSVGLSAISQMLMPEPSFPSPADRLVNFAQPIAYMERVYGRTRKGGPIGFTGFRRGILPAGYGRVDRQSRRHYAVLIAAHSTKGPVEHWLDDRVVEVDGNGNVETAPIGDRGSIRTYTGQPGQAVDPVLDAVFPEIGAGHDFAGLSYAALFARRPSDDAFTEVYPNGREWTYAPVWDGNDRIYDPRTGTHVWTRNAALIMAHEFVTYWGAEVDWADVAVEADVCDQLVTNGTGGTQPRWRIDGAIGDDMEFDAVRAQMMAAADAFVFERPDGKIGFRVGRWTPPTVTLTERDFITLEVSEGDDIGAPNIFTAQYPEPANRWREAPTGPWVHDPAGNDIRREIAAYMCSSHNQGVRIAKRVACAERPKYRLSGTLNMRGYDLIGQRFAMFSHSELGFSFPIEIGKLTWNGDRITFGLEAVSTAAEDFDFTAATEEPARPVYEAVASDDAVDIPTGLSGEAMQSTGGTAEIRWTWPEQDESLTQQLRIRISPDDWTIITVPTGQAAWPTTGLVDGATYEAQLRNRTSAGRVSDWAPVDPITVLAVANQVPPADLVDFDVTPGSGAATLTMVPPNDAQYFATRIWRSLTTSFGDASVVRIEYGAATTSDSWTDTPLAPDDYSYWAEPINASGIAGTRAGPITVTII